MLEGGADGRDQLTKRVALGDRLHAGEDLSAEALRTRLRRDDGEKRRERRRPPPPRTVSRALLEDAVEARRQVAGPAAPGDRDREARRDHGTVDVAQRELELGEFGVERVPVTRADPIMVHELERPGPCRGQQVPHRRDQVGAARERDARQRPAPRRRADRWRRGAA